MRRESLKRLSERGYTWQIPPKIEDKAERKKLKRAARKKAAPKAKRTAPRGEKKKKVKKLARGQSKRNSMPTRLGSSSQPFAALQAYTEPCRTPFRRDELKAPVSTPTGPSRRTALPSQLLARKSIDKLISDSEEPGHALKKTLGPWSLTALGIGAVIGSGIFTVIGTAMAGQSSIPPAFGNTPLIHYLIRHTAMAGRPGAGPALALSLVLVAIVCALHRALLRRAGVDDSDCGIGVHVHLCDAGRAGGVDHRLGSDSRICLQQHERERGLCRAHRGSAGLVRPASAR